MKCKHCKSNNTLTTNSVSVLNKYNKDDKYVVVDYYTTTSIKNIFKFKKLKVHYKTVYTLKATTDLKDIIYTCPDCKRDTVIKSVMPIFKGDDFNANCKEWTSLGWVIINIGQ